MSTTHVCLVMLENHQEYIHDTIRQLLRIGYTKITVLTNERFRKVFTDAHPVDSVSVFAVEQLNPGNYTKQSTLDRSFRNGFWYLTSLRFYYLLDWMRQTGATNVIHTENDVLLYDHFDKYMGKCMPDRVYVPMDAPSRCICSVMWIPNADVWSKCMDKYDRHKNDMNNFAMLRNTSPHLIETFPIFNNEVHPDNTIRQVSRNYLQFGIVFDAAAMGQYLGGIDPRNQAGDTRGFINETCVVKYNQHSFEWAKDQDTGIWRPYLRPNHSPRDYYKIPIFNLHIHCKDLRKYMYETEVPENK